MSKCPYPTVHNCSSPNTLLNLPNRIDTDSIVFIDDKVPVYNDIN